MKANNFEHFRYYLQEELIKRCKVNPEYSLRAFAHSLGTDSSSLSKILNKKRRITEKMFCSLSSKLNLSPKEIQSFYGKIEDDEYLQLSDDRFRLISEWYHYAILELVHLETFVPSKNWIAGKLGINVLEVSGAIERLLRLGYLEIIDNKWVDVSANVSSYPNLDTTVPHKTQQKDFLNLAIEKIDTIDFKKRDQSGITMAIDSKKINLAKRMIKDFRRTLCEVLEAENKDEVYHLSISLFPLTKTKEL